MSYEKTVWRNNDIITASKLNKIENGIASAVDVCPIVAIYFPNSTVGYQVLGLDFQTALSMVQEGIPFVAFAMSYNSSGGWFASFPANTLAIYYTEDYPNRIDLQITGGVGYYWTANGIEYYD